MLARKTEWAEAGGDAYVGIGQRLFATDQNDYALMDMRELLIDAGGDASDE